MLVVLSKWNVLCNVQWKLIPGLVHMLSAELSLCGDVPTAVKSVIVIV